MKNKIQIISVTILLTIIPLKLWAVEQNEHKHDQYAATFIPEPYNKIKLKKTHIKEVEQIIGKADLVEKNKHYYIVNNFKYALEIVYKKDVVSELSYTFTKQRPSVTGMAFPLIPSGRFPASKEKTERYFKYTDQSGELKVDPVHNTVNSMRLK
jgi:hypothetical protein